MAMAAAGCKPMTIFPLPLHTHRNHCRVLNRWQQIESHAYHKNERSFNISRQALHVKKETPRCVCLRAVPEGDGDRENCNKVCKDENANINVPLCEGKTETKSHASPERLEPVKEEQQQQQQQQSSVEKVKPEPIVGRFHYFSRLGFCKTTTTPRDGDLQNDPKQDLRCRLRLWWRHATQPQNLLAAFLTGLLLYAFALFGWQVMVVAVDVTLFVLKCSFAAVVLLFMYILLI